MYKTNPYAAYQERNVMTLSPGELTLMLYDGSIKALRRASLFLSEGGMVDAHNELLRVQNILAELQTTLDMQYEVSQGLYALYEYMREAVTEANVNKNAANLPDIIALLTELRDAWQQAIRTNRRNTMVDQEAQ
jgi:flagellar protein FliS